VGSKGKMIIPYQKKNDWMIKSDFEDKLQIAKGIKSSFRGDFRRVENQAGERKGGCFFPLSKSHRRAMPVVQGDPDFLF
jgi:hypothetical protein